jgi:hypothetical protein
MMTGQQEEVEPERIRSYLEARRSASQASALESV